MVSSDADYAARSIELITKSNKTASLFRSSSFFLLLTFTTSHSCPSLLFRLTTRSVCLRAEPIPTPGSFWQYPVRRGPTPYYKEPAPHQFQSPTLGDRPSAAVIVFSSTLGYSYLSLSPATSLGFVFFLYTESVFESLAGLIQFAREVRGRVVSACL